MAGHASGAGVLALLLGLAATGSVLPAGDPVRAPGERAPPRIVALAPHVAELVWAAGAGDLLVGVVAGSDWPAPVRDLPVIGAAGRLDRERIVALAPNLAIGWASGDPPADLAWLRARGVAVHATDARRLEDVATTLRDIGRLAGREGAAVRAAAAFERELADIRPVASGPRPRVYYQVWDRPLLTVSAGHVIGHAIEHCGGENVFARLPQPVPAVSAEAVLAADPDLVLAARTAGDPFARWRARPGLRAVRTGQARLIDPDLLHRPGPRLVQGLRELCAALAGS